MLRLSALVYTLLAAELAAGSNDIVYVTDKTLYTWGWQSINQYYEYLNLGGSLDSFDLDWHIVVKAGIIKELGIDEDQWDANTGEYVSMLYVASLDDDWDPVATFWEYCNTMPWCEYTYQEDPWLSGRRRRLDSAGKMKSGSESSSDEESGLKMVSRALKAARQMRVSNGKGVRVAWTRGANATDVKNATYAKKSTEVKNTKEDVESAEPAYPDLTDEEITEFADVAAEAYRQHLDGDSEAMLRLSGSNPFHDVLLQYFVVSSGQDHMEVIPDALMETIVEAYEDGDWDPVTTYNVYRNMLSQKAEMVNSENSSLEGARRRLASINAHRRLLDGESN